MVTAARRRTKIVATIGPRSSDTSCLSKLVAAGMDGARLNFSHGTHEEHAERVQLLRDVQEEHGRPVALIADLQGPKLRVGELPAPVRLESGDDVELIGGEHPDNGALPVSPAVIGEVLRPGHDVLIDDGLIRLKVEHVANGRVRCAVVVGGAVGAHKGVNLPGVPVPVPSLTRKDVGDLEFALSLGVDFVALSFVRSAADIRDLRRLIDEAGSTARVIAKIEKAEAKRIILRALERAKPVITATQMLESMVHNAEPTRAEASDVANAILDGTSAVMLSGETAIGDYPVQSVRTMDAIAREVEPSLGYRHQLPNASEEPSVGNAMSNAACDLAEALGAVAILVPTFSGRTASAVARLRPRRPIVGLSHHQYALQQMALEWGVTPLRIAECADVEELWSASLGAARDARCVNEGDRVVITAGTAVNIPGSTNVIKVDVA